MSEKTDAVYKGLWKCRDLEINMLWTRLTLLGTFMALTYTGYGVLVIKIVDGVRHWELFNLLAVSAGCLGTIFSVFWIVTAKGSKGWFERYESMIKFFQHTHKEELKDADGNSLLSYLDYGSSELKPFLAPVDSSLFTQYSGRYSVSKIPIVMGQLSLFGWGAIIGGHTLCLLMGREYMRSVVENLGFKIVYCAVMMLCLVVFVICQRVRSSSL